MKEHYNGKTYEFDFSQEILAEKEKKTLNKPFRTPSGPKKFSVYVKNEKGNVVKVNFGDPNMEIKRDDPQRRKNFRARHKRDLETKDFKRAGFLSYFLLWGDNTTLKKNIDDYKKKFNLD